LELAMRLARALRHFWGAKISSGDVHAATYAKGIGPPNRSQVEYRPIQDKVLRTLHSIHKGFEVEMVRKLGDGQDITLEVDEVIKQPAGVNREWEMAANLIDNAPNPAMNRPPSGFVLRLAG